MKKRSIILRVLPDLFNVIRIILLVSGACLLLVTTARFIKSDYIELTAPLRVAKRIINTGISPKNADIKDISVATAVPILTAMIKVSFWIVIGTYLYIIASCLIMVVQMQNLRDFFKSIKIGQPFDPKNVERLRIIATMFLAFGIVSAIKQLAINILLTQKINNLHFSELYWSIAFIGLLWSIVIFVIADVFKYGFLLKKENEEFV